MKRNILASLLTVILAVAAHAEGQRVIVVLKSKETFRAAHTVFQKQGEFALKGFDLSLGMPKNSLAKVNGQVEESLENLNTLIVNVENQAELEKLMKNTDVAMIEPEIMHPAPKPFRGSIFPAMTSYDILARRKKFPRKPVPPTPGQGSGDLIDFTPSSFTPWGILAVKAVDAWSLSTQGSGARVMILDTGIDKDHPSLRANFEKGQDFVGDNNQPYAFADQVGHGSHVAGTIAGAINAAGFTGVAPQAKILMGRVCSNEGCPNTAIARGLNWAIQEKVDVISLSLGGAMSTPAERRAITQATAAGITVVAASGNDGTEKVSYPAALPECIAVGAVDSKLQKTGFSQWGPELAIVAPGADVVSSVPQGSGREAQVTIATANTSPQAVKSVTFEGSKEVSVPLEGDLVEVGLGKAEEFAKVNVVNKIALVARGEIKFMEKVQNAINAKAAAIIIYNNEPGLVHGALTQDGSKLPVAVFMIEQQVGLSLKKSLNAGIAGRARLAIVTSDYASFDGTSMATPHVSGVVALIKAANKKLTPAQVKEIIQSTAQALGPNEKNQYGAGLINADAAVRAAINHQ